MPKVTFLPAGVTVEVAEGATLFEVGREHGVTIDTACVGKGTCGLCRVRIVAGEEHLDPYNDVEERHLGNVYFLTKVRLSCQSVVRGDVTVELAPKKKPRKKR